MNNSDNKDKLTVVHPTGGPKVRCRKCGQEMQRIPRTSFARTVLFWSSLRRYYCYGCLRKRWAKLPK